MSCSYEKDSCANSMCPRTGNPACARPWPTINDCNSYWKRFASTNGSGSRTAGRNDVLRRLIHYPEKRYRLPGRAAQRGRRRPAPAAHPTPVVVQSVLLLFWARLGSLNALETLAPAPFWKTWLGREIPSPDTIGRVYNSLAADGPRPAIHPVYERLKRNKALPGIGAPRGVASCEHSPGVCYRKGRLSSTCPPRDSNRS